MRIEQAQLRLSAESSLTREEFRIRQVNPPAARAQALADRAPVQATPATDRADEPLDAKLLMMRLVAEVMLGRRIELFHMPVGGAAAAVQVTGAQQAQVRTIQVQAEAEDVRFQARGSVETTDGRRIDFQADMRLSRRFVQVDVRDVPNGKQDPLVLNFDGMGVRLLGDRVSFDLSGDGQPESMPLVAPGSGLLFADRNRDGVANDGSELFGPHSGNGFAELALQDADGNGWIDQGDPVFGELRVWFQDDAGPGLVYTLADLGIGAVSTSSVDTPFDLRTARNGLLGQIRASGVYLREDGQPGIVSQVDLVL